MVLMYTLTMPNRASWNGKWSGDDVGHHIFRTVRSKKDIERAKELDGKSYWHRWDDGWTACVSCRCITGKEITWYRKHNGGFSGYDWMCDSIWQGWVDENFDQIFHKSPTERRMKENAKMEVYRNDLLFECSFLIKTDANAYEFFWLKWWGYNDSNWWDNVSTTKQAQEKEFTGADGTKKKFRIDFKTKAVYEVLENAQD